MENLDGIEERKLLISRIQTPDGTILESKHTHDCVFYTDENGLEYMLDGGNEYQRTIVQESAPYKDLSIYEDDPYEKIRTNYKVNIYDDDVTSILLCDLSDEWLEKSLKTNSIKHKKTRMLCEQETEYRRNMVYKLKFNPETGEIHLPPIDCKDIPNQF
jgi:hypothetical protein